MTTILIDENTEDGRDSIECLRKNKSGRILDETEDADWWQDLSGQEKMAIEESLADIDKGKTVPYGQIKKRLTKILLR